MNGTRAFAFTSNAENVTNTTTELLLETLQCAPRGSGMLPAGRRQGNPVGLFSRWCAAAQSPPAASNSNINARYCWR